MPGADRGLVRSRTGAGVAAILSVFLGAVIAVVLNTDVWWTILSLCGATLAAGTLIAPRFRSFNVALCAIGLMCPAAAPSLWAAIFLRHHPPTRGRLYLLLCGPLGGLLLASGFSYAHPDLLAIAIIQMVAPMLAATLGAAIHHGSFERSGSAQSPRRWPTGLHEEALRYAEETQVLLRQETATLGLLCMALMDRTSLRSHDVDAAITGLTVVERRLQNILDDSSRVITALDGDEADPVLWEQGTASSSVRHLFEGGPRSAGVIRGVWDARLDLIDEPAGMLVDRFCRHILALTEAYDLRETTALEITIDDALTVVARAHGAQLVRRIRSDGGSSRQLAALQHRAFMLSGEMRIGKKAVTLLVPRPSQLSALVRDSPPVED